MCCIFRKTNALYSKGLRGNFESRGGGGVGRTNEIWAFGGGRGTLQKVAWQAKTNIFVFDIGVHHYGLTDTLLRIIFEIMLFLSFCSPKYCIKILFLQLCVMAWKYICEQVKRSSNFL